MGAVYRVHDKELDRDVALKLIRSDIAENASTLARFKREIQLSSKVTHRTSCASTTSAKPTAIKFLTMQLVEGEDLVPHPEARGQAPDRRASLKIFRQICEGLGAAHEQGVIHRDLKPQNVMLDAADHVYRDGLRARQVARAVGHDADRRRSSARPSTCRPSR